MNWRENLRRGEEQLRASKDNLGEKKELLRDRLRRSRTKWKEGHRDTPPPDSSEAFVELLETMGILKANIGSHDSFAETAKAVSEDLTRSRRIRGLARFGYVSSDSDFFQAINDAEPDHGVLIRAVIPDSIMHPTQQRGIGSRLKRLRSRPTKPTTTDILLLGLVGIVTIEENIFFAGIGIMDINKGKEVHSSAVSIAEDGTAIIIAANLVIPT